MSIVFLISTIIFVLIILLVRPGIKSVMAICAITINAGMSSWIAVQALMGNNFSEVLYGGNVFGNIFIRLDSVSAWFVLLSNFTMLNGILYGHHYIGKYKSRPADLSLHFSSYVLNHAALTGVFFIQNSLAFLCTWEIMALTACILIIFEYGKFETLKAGILYLIQSHIAIVLLTLGFIWVYANTGSLDFNAILTYCNNAGKEASLLLFLVFFAAFGIKAGFVPFHTWLPYAHPAAPSHVSGIMSGVIIKTGIYGILRILLLMPHDKLIIGYIILTVSVISGVYGVMLAIVQHNLKRLLAYHSIENIGIIGIGIGIGAIGSGLDNPVMAFAGYAGALMHTLNHSLFKSLLFFTAGNVYQTAHTLIIDRMGGLIHKMPRTALLFLLGALSICGLPPFNGFVSEFLIYSGLFNAIGNNQSPLAMALSVLGLTLIGGLALMCFTKAFGTIFLGTGRRITHESRMHSNSTNSMNDNIMRVPDDLRNKNLSEEIKEANGFGIIPNYLIAGFIIIIGLFPGFFISLLVKPVSLFADVPGMIQPGSFPMLMKHISLAAWALILLIVIVYLIRKILSRYNPPLTGPTWGCGYEGSGPGLQYTASSFVRPYVKLIKPLIVIKKSEEEITSIIPNQVRSESHFYDKLEKGFVDWPTRNLRGFLGKFKFLQNGSVQFYVLYGVVFICISIAIPFVIDAIKSLVSILKQL